ncbi:MAG: carbohydrate ABC transporter permease [Spirochaetales bacterium]|jgi:multiple sugar transport system permease protein|nr:carbohydrate ABC transporter permease [Spirochaetales bacterium]
MTIHKRSTTVIRTLLLALGALLYLIPFLYALYTSLLSKADLGSVVGPSRWVLDNYRYVIGAGLFGWYKNSLIMTAGIIAGNLVLNTLAGYALARIEFPGKKIIFFVIIGTMMISGQITIVPIYIMAVKLGWINTYKALIIPFLTNGMLTFFMRQFFLSIPIELEESARIDGLGRFGMFGRIVLPISKMSLATQVIFLFREWWNQLLWPVTLTNKLEMFVITVGLNSLKGQYYEWMNVSMTGVVCTILPVIVLFILMQRQFTQSLALVGIKG